MTIAEMAQMVAEKSGKISVVFDIPKDALQFGYAPSVKMKLSSEKLRSLGWKSDIDLSEMYERMIKSWKKHLNKIVLRCINCVILYKN